MLSLFLSWLDLLSNVHAQPYVSKYSCQKRQVHLTFTVARFSFSRQKQWVNTHWGKNTFFVRKFIITVSNILWKTEVLIICRIVNHKNYTYFVAIWFSQNIRTKIWFLAQCVKETRGTLFSRGKNTKTFSGSSVFLSPKKNSVVWCSFLSRPYICLHYSIKS